MQDNDAARPAGRDPLPRHTTPTWEMELLLSAATVFGLMQLPALLDEALFSLVPRFERDAGTLILLPYLYVKSAVYVLVITFLLHLALRGYWTALVGLNSVYPQGVNWEALRWGPAYLAALRQRSAPMPEMIERADNRASQVFGFGIGFALAFLAPLLLIGATSVLAFGLQRLLWPEAKWQSLWYLILAVMMLPYLAAIAVDRLLARRLQAESSPRRVLRAVFGFYLRIGFHSLANYPVTLFMSRVGKHRGGAVIMLTMLLIVGASMASQFWDRIEPGIGQYGPLSGLGVGQPRTVLPGHYADQRGDAVSLSPLPFVDSTVVDGDYLRLFIPFRPARDMAALRERCAPLRAADASEAEAIGRGLDCLTSLYPIVLDGTPIADPQFDRATDVATGLRGVQAMIRVADLPRGRHELEIGRPRNPVEPADAAPLPPYRIPFWR